MAGRSIRTKEEKARIVMEALTGSTPIGELTVANETLKKIQLSRRGGKQ